MKLSDLIDKAESAGACECALAELRSCETLEDVLSHPDAGSWAVWARSRGILPESLCSAYAVRDEAFCKA